MIQALLVILSACLYGVSYIWPFYCWWMGLIFLVPLLYGALNKQLSYVHGLVWSTTAFTIHLSGILAGLFGIAEGHFIMRILLPLLVLFAAIGYGVLWFMVTLWLSKKNGSYMRLSIWVMSTWLFFLWMEHCSIFMGGRCEGYLLANPLVPLVHFPALLYFMPKIGSVFFLLFFIMSQGLIVAALFWRHCWPAVILFLTGFWGTQIFLWQNQEKYLHVPDKLVCGTVCFSAGYTPRNSGRLIRDFGKDLLKKYPEVQIILFPESALHCPFMVGEPQIVEFLNRHEWGKPITLLIGGFRWDNDIYRNTVYWIHDGKLVDLFDKRHTMAFTERSPHYFLPSVIKDAYFKTGLGIVAASGRRPVWKIAPDLTIVPYICSELFFNHSPDNSPKPEEVIIALCNDNWLSSDFMRYQMLMGARYRSIHWQVPIMYVAYFYQALCEPWGGCYPLKAYGHP